MKILITNDDGVNAKGLRLLAEKLSQFNDVVIVAPSHNRSGSSTSLTIGGKLKLTRLPSFNGVKVYSLSGTPADCVNFWHHELSDYKVDLVISGINNGFNVGNAILYSGTTGASIEGLVCGYNSIALSVPTNTEYLEFFVEKSLEIINLLSQMPKSAWNVNFPNLSPEKIKGIKFARIGKAIYTDHYERDNEGNYFLAGDFLYNPENETDTDVYYLKQGYIAISPISLEKTDYNILHNL